MKHLFISICGISANAFAQGGPNGPPNPACSSPNPPPWCPDNPSVPIDSWELMLMLLVSGIVLGYFYINQLQKDIKE